MSAAATDRVVLYRCPTPTNWLCPCGAVERRLRKLGVEHRTERVPYRRSARPEIEELTKQRRLPVLVDEDEVIHDSKRIIQYLEWRHAAREDDARRSTVA
ncbi:MAG TPA: glutathione S-transferase N-terminal domain-containing protein [Solirubrobacterales bacterium]|nr:glutathione S-transferase N-terminal domain-containing protein [Solirubrobacterales bacterium]